MSPLYPPVEPYARGVLPVGGDEGADPNQIYWETCGNPSGRPVLVVHGGPGSGCSAGSRRYFDPTRYRIILFDQRGCGRSTPHAADPSTDLRHNTTDHLIADMELLRRHLGVDRWSLYGASWGSTLALAYAERHPERVSGIVIAGVTTTRRAEIDWLYGGVARFLPQEWERFRAAMAPSRATHPGSAQLDPAPAVTRGRDLAAACARLMEHPDPEARASTAREWCAWEDAVISLEPNGRKNVYSDRAPAARLALVRICAHYFAHGAWLEEGILLREAGRLAGIPGVLIHGRQDLGAPFATAWELARAWPGARLVPVTDSGHTGSESLGKEIIRALDDFAAGDARGHLPPFGAPDRRALG